MSNEPNQSPAIVGIGRGRERPIDIENGSSEQVFGGTQAHLRPAISSGRPHSTKYQYLHSKVVFALFENQHETLPKQAPTSSEKWCKKNEKKTTTPVVNAAVEAAKLTQQIYNQVI
jgi:hypothetical protein